MSIDEAVMHLDAIAENTPRRRRNLTVFRGEANKARLKELVGMEIGESYVDAGFPRRTCLLSAFLCAKL